MADVVVMQHDTICLFSTRNPVVIAWFAAMGVGTEWFNPTYAVDVRHMSTIRKALEDAGFSVTDRQVAREGGMDFEFVWCEIKRLIAEGDPDQKSHGWRLDELLVELSKWIRKGGQWPAP